MNKHLLSEIDRLKLEIISLAATVEQAIRHAVRALFERDRVLAENVIERDRKIDQIEVEIEEDCLKTLALYQPVASDLRFMIAVLKVNNELERIGDIAKNMAERALDLLDFEPTPIPPELEEMSRKAEAMVRASLDALISLDVNLARKVRADDAEVDALNRQMFAMIQKRMQAEPEKIMVLMEILSVSRYLERIADLATNISEDVIYLVEGTIARHVKRTNTSRLETAASDKTVE